MTALDERPALLPGSTCILLREGRMTHQCKLPMRGQDPPRGMVIRCECGRRYISRLISHHSGTMWQRRILPWPRTPKVAS